MTLIGALGAWLLRVYAFEGIYVATGSMEPGLPVGAHLFLDKVTYNFREPQRGEVVIFTAPVPPGEEMVKRIIGVAGDTIEIKEKKVFRNGQELTEPYIKHTRPEERLRGDNLGPLTVPSSHYFVLGDNRDESDDSTVWRDTKTDEPIYFVGRSAIRGMTRGAY